MFILIIDIKNIFTKGIPLLYIGIYISKSEGIFDVDDIDHMLSKLYLFKYLFIHLILSLLEVLVFFSLCYFSASSINFKL